MYDIGLFEINEADEDIKIKALINTPYTYDNIVRNPVLKPISETDKNLVDIEEMIIKDLIDANKDKAYINSVIADTPYYQDSPFIARLIKLVQSTQNIIKMQDLRDRNLKRCIQEMYEILELKYAIKIGNDFENPKEVIPEGGYLNYLKKLSESSDEKINSIAKEILDFFSRDEKEMDEKRKYENACITFYKKQSDKKIKERVGKIIRMEI